MYGLRQSDSRNQIDIQRLQPVLTARSKAVILIGAGQIDQQVHRPEHLTQPCQGFADLGIPGDINGKESRLFAQLFGRLPTGFGVNVEQRHTRACVDQTAGHGHADQCRAATDQCDLALQGIGVEKCSHG